MIENFLVLTSLGNKNAHIPESCMALTEVWFLLQLDRNMLLSSIISLKTFVFASGA